MPILGADINISGHAALIYSINQEGNGLYSVELNCSTVITTYSIVITASRTNYEQKSVNFILIVEEFESTLDNLEPITPVTLSVNISMSLFYYEPGNSAQNYTGALIEGSTNLTSDYLVANVDYIYQDNLNGTYALILYTGDGTNFNETGQFSVYIHASRLYVKNASRKVDIFLNEKPPPFRARSFTQEFNDGDGNRSLARTAGDLPGMCG